MFVLRREHAGCYYHTIKTSPKTVITLHTHLALLGFSDLLQYYNYFCASDVKTPSDAQKSAKQSQRLDDEQPVMKC